MKYLLLPIMLLLFISCGDDDDGGGEEVAICTTEVRDGVVVTVLDAMTNQPLEGVTINATEGSFMEQLRESSTGVFRGLAERAGTYSLVIEKAGYQTVIEGVVVTQTEDLCHVITENVTVTLEEL